MKTRKSLLEIGINLEQYFGLSLFNVEFSGGRPRNLRASKFGTVVSISIILLITHCIYVVIKNMHEIPGIEAVFKNNMQILIRPIFYAKQMLLTTVPFVAQWIWFSKARQLYDLVLIQAPRRLRNFHLENHWIIDGSHLIIVFHFTLDWLNLPHSYLSFGFVHVILLPCTTVSASFPFHQLMMLD